MKKRFFMLFASLLAWVGMVWADAPVEGQRYRLKNVSTGLYMQTNGNNSNLQLQEQKYSVTQFFHVEAAEGGLFYLKSETGANKYVNASSWNAVISDGATTPYTIALVDGETDVYTLDQTVSNYTGKIGADAGTAGSSLYCNKGVGNNGKWQFEAVETPEVCDFDPTKTYRIKSEYSGLYMQLVSYTQTSGEGAFQLKDKSVVADGQKFVFEDAGDGKYYLKTIKDETTYYVNQDSWNFIAGAEATTPFTIAVVDGHTAVYSIHQTLNAGYAGNVNENVFADGTKIYCNQTALTGNTIWSFEEVVADPNNITELGQLSNDCYYKISGERGFIFGAEGVVKGTNVVSQAYSEGNENQHFAIINKDGQYYLYNVGQKKFVVKSGNNTSLVDLPEQPITLEKTSSKDYAWSILLNGTNKINLSSGWNSYGVYTDYNTEDAGNRWLIYKVGTFDPSEALSCFGRVYVTLNYMLGEEQVLTVKETITAGGTYSFSNPYAYATVTSCTVGGNELSATDGVYSFTANEHTVVTVNLSEELPFIVTEEGNDTTWHAMRIRPVRNGADNVQWVAKSATVPYPNSSTRTTTDDGLWAFTGNSVNGIQIYNRGAAQGMTLGVDGSGVVMKEGITTWTVGKCIEGGNLRGFYLYQGTENKYAHDLNGNLQIWNSVSAKTDGGSAFVAYPVYTLTVVYQFNGEEVDGLGMEKTFVDAGYVYTTESDLGGKVIESCTVNGEAVEVVNGACSIIVNANTTVTVTLKEENAEESVFTPVEGKMYALKVSDTELYLDILTMGVNEPGQSNTNNISLSAAPCIIYFEAGTDGKWRMKNTDGKYVRQADSRDWNAVIGESAYDWTFVETEGFVSIARADGKYVSTDNLSAGQPLYCDKGVGLEFCFMEVIDCPTAATSQNNKYHFTSEKIEYTALCNKLRFILTESGAFFQNGANRMSLDEFVLYGSDGEKINLTAADVTGNNGKTYVGLFDGVNGVYGGTATWDSGTEDDWFEITLPNGIELNGAFSFSFVTENTTMNAKAFRILLSYEKQIRYTFDIQAPQGQDITATYDGEEILSGAELGKGFDADLFAANDISGYTWSIVVDEENLTVTLVYTAAPVMENPEAVVALINRIGGAGTAGKFKFVIDPSMNSKQETFVIGSEEGKILIKGSTMSAVTTGIGWYLNNYANINISWNSLNEKTVSGDAYADLSDLPIPTEEETRTCDAKYRYYLNYCTFGYSMTSWTWKRWQQEIDWMALHGINMPLQIVGLEEVWRKFLTLEENGQRKYGYTDEEAKAFVAGPAFTAWWGMNNLEGWGGTGADGWGGVQDDAWYERQANLAKQITDLQRELGMQPVLPGFSGMVPSNFASKAEISTINPGAWGGFTRPHIIEPSNASFAGVAADYYACLKEVMGESQYYSMDPFHEGAGHLASVQAYATIYDAMEAAKPGSQWVIQQWQWWGNNQTLSLQGVPASKLIVLDLFSDGDPDFDDYGYNGYAPQDAVFCVIPNFGGRSGLMGRLQNMADNYFTYKAKYDNIKGVGAAPEAIEQTPVTYDLIYQLPWMGTKPDVAEWVAKYAVARYGVDNSVVKEVWNLLRQGPLNYGADAIQGPVEDVWAARPNLEAYAASTWGSTISRGYNIPAPGNTYTPARRQMLIDATYKLLGQEDALDWESGSIYESNYLYDIVEFGGAVMADYAHDLLLGIRDAKNAEGTSGATYIARRDAFLQLILDMDAFRGTNLNFRLGKWTQEARDAAVEAKGYGATIANEDWYEFNNARTIITTWGDESQNSGLKDYSYRSWQGLLKDYYYPRWKYYFDNNCNGTNYFFFEWNWAHGMKHQVGDTQKSTTRLASGETGYSYTREPEGNTVEEATKMLGKYIIPVVTADGTYYAYRYLTNDLSAKVTIIGGSETIDLTKSFGTLEGATVTGDFIEGGTATDLTAIPVKSGLTEASYTGTITLADGTVLTFAVVPNPEYYGVYRIKYNNYPVFIQYNETQNQTHDGIGYKLITPSESVVAEAEGDELFAIVPCGSGYSISAQGKYLQTTNSSRWTHLMFSDDKGEAGAYVFEETSTAIFKIRSTGSGINYVNNYGQVFGNDKSDKENLSTFTLVEVTEYAITIPEGDTITTLHLPFNVVLASGLEAYDVTAGSLVAAGGKGTGVWEKVAQAGETIKAGTPVIIKGNAGTYKLAITMDNSGAKTSLDNSALRGNFVKQALTADGAMKKYLFANGAFAPVETDTEASANSVWVETDMDFDNLGFTEIEGDYVKVDNWLFEYKLQDKGIQITDAVVEGDGSLVIAPTYMVNGVKTEVIALADDFLYGNTTVTSVTLPATLSDIGVTPKLFVGCTNLREIHVEDGSNSFWSCDYGVLYNKSGTHILRFPGGGGRVDANGRRHFDIDKKVTRLYAGSLHNVDADITFHSNPEILHVEGDEEYMKARYYLSLEDAGAVDFESDNSNTFQTVRYERAPLAEGTYGTIVLPFKPDAESLEKYDFFEFYSGDTEGLTFSQVDEVKANTPYLYRMVDDEADEITGGLTTIVSVGDSVPVAHHDGVWRTVGTYRTDSVLTAKHPESYYYYLSVSSGKFHRVTKQLNYRPYRAFFVMTPKGDNGTAQAAAPRLALRFRDGSTTEIAPNQIEGWTEPVYYDLMGRRVVNPTGGVYIVNGKKMVIE